ncbi:unnamed protein product [Schistosoma mattheei]|uniref:Uncharacterized protein n=1 Tax=Schistosoma mattheei TaxID=31246 RepID=A0A183Q6D4_9TREM|nr:unnamed protein product [Schistosoma mattheei]
MFDYETNITLILSIKCKYSKLFSLFNRNLTESQNSEQKNLQKKIDEFNKFRLELGRRIGLSEMNADLANVMEKVSQRLDEAALLELKCTQNTSNLNRTITELNSIKRSTDEVTKRSEEYIQERKILNEVS